MRGKHVHFFKDQSAHSPEEPFFIHSFSLDLPDLALAYFETVNNVTARLNHVHLVILSVYQGDEDFLASSFRKLIEFFFLDHGTPFPGKCLRYCEGMIPWGVGMQQAQLDPLRV
jgi:hypothetical protein